jgi:hypothetical protein
LQTLKCKLADTADTHTQPEMKEERRELSFEREREREREIQTTNLLALTVFFVFLAHQSKDL